jgi:hypothetical protein
VRLSRAKLAENWHFIVLNLKFDNNTNKLISTVYVDGITMGSGEISTTNDPRIDQTAVITVGNRLDTQYNTVPAPADGFTACAYTYVYSLTIYDAERSLLDVREFMSFECMQNLSNDECQICPSQLE